MRRALVLSLLILATLPAAASAAAVKLVACVPALEREQREATFEARVRAARGSERMQIRFTLQQRDDALERWRRVMADGLGEWLTSEPLVDRYVYERTVRNLSAPSSYRMVVRFRWLDGDGDVIARGRAASRTCRQPDMRPDLRPTGIAVAPAVDAGPADYAVTVRNDGRTASGPSGVALSVGDLALAPLPLQGLAPGERAVLHFSAPACAPGSLLTALVDPAGTVEERDEADDALLAACAL